MSFYYGSHFTRSHLPEVTVNWEILLQTLLLFKFCCCYPHVEKRLLLCPNCFVIFCAQIWLFKAPFFSHITACEQHLWLDIFVGGVSQELLTGAERSLSTGSCGGSSAVLC